MPLSVIPVLALDRPPTEGEVRDLIARFSRTMRTWFARRGVQHELRWALERSIRQGIHFHGMMGCPWRMRTETRQHARTLLFRLLGVKVEKGVDLPPRVARAVRLHGRQGGVGATKAKGWLAYTAATFDPATSFTEKAQAALPVSGRRFGQPQRRGGAHG
ncbi:hypothetical protein VQH23_26540 (plasmid) [Pararoseomonas sp. SCSIO 73927]|uniref:hypothetical protein n=1 Tax=Pararoseomonas sp. SCSIO 73927 TaxID=3114537 RepID=UPI0030D25E27